MKAKLHTTYKTKIKTKRNGNIWFKGSFLNGLLYLQKRNLLEGDNVDKIISIDIYPRYILFGETMLEFTIKNQTT